MLDTQPPRGQAPKPRRPRKGASKGSQKGFYLEMAMMELLMATPEEEQQQISVIYNDKPVAQFASDLMHVAATLLREPGWLVPDSGAGLTGIGEVTAKS